MFIPAGRSLVSENLARDARRTYYTFCDNRKLSYLSLQKCQNQPDNRCIIQLIKRVPTARLQEDQPCRQTLHSDSTTDHSLNSFSRVVGVGWRSGGCICSDDGGQVQRATRSAAWRWVQPASLTQVLPATAVHPQVGFSNKGIVSHF